MARGRSKAGVYGHKETARALKAMSQQFETPISTASRFALYPMLNDAKANLRQPKPGHPQGNVVTGELVDSMKILKVKRVPRGKVQYHVTASGKGISKAHLVEFGTDPHWQPKRGVIHPGAKPFPFLTPAFEKNDDVAQQRFGQKIGPAIEGYAARAAARNRSR